jgi:hypothetical protein
MKLLTLLMMLSIRRIQAALEDGVRKLQPMRRPLVTIPPSNSTTEYMNRILFLDYLTTLLNCSDY